MPRNPHGVSLGAAPLGVQVGVRVEATVTPPAPAPGGEGARDLVPPPAIVSLGALRDSAALQGLLSEIAHLTRVTLRDSAALQELLSEIVQHYKSYSEKTRSVRTYCAIRVTNGHG